MDQKQIRSHLQSNGIRVKSNFFTGFNLNNPFLLPMVLSGTFLIFLSSCAAVEGIFKAGMGFGIFVVIAVIAIILFLIFKAGKKNSSK